MDERKIKVIEAVEMFADVVRSDAPFSERVEARKAFVAALDEALADPEVERLRWYEQQAQGYVEAWNKATSDAARLREALRKVAALEDREGDCSMGPEYWAGIGEAVDIARSALDEDQA